MADPQPSYRPITNLFDIDTAPAVELAAREVILRSKRPERIEQEFYALLLAHAAVRKLMTRAAATGQAAGDLSFIHAAHVLRRSLPASVAIFP